MWGKLENRDTRFLSEKRVNRPQVEVVLGAFDSELELSCRCAGQDAIASLGREYTRTSSSRVCRRHANRHRAIFSQVRQDGLYALVECKGAG